MEIHVLFRVNSLNLSSLSTGMVNSILGVPLGPLRSYLLMYRDLATPAQGLRLHLGLRPRQERDRRGADREVPRHPHHRRPQRPPLPTALSAVPFISTDGTGRARSDARHRLRRPLGLRSPPTQRQDRPGRAAGQHDQPVITSNGKSGIRRGSSSDALHSRLSAVEGRPCQEDAEEAGSAVARSMSCLCQAADTFFGTVAVRPSSLVKASAPL